MVKPAPFPQTDAAEQDAVTVFRNLIDTRYVKAEIKTRDKYPNVDGTVELVDRDQVPFGKLDVQIRKIPHGSTKYSCPQELVGYSEVSTLPVILVVADPVDEKAYWKLISPTMPEYKEGQRSFTIYFDPASDSVDRGGLYIQKWTEIVRDFRERIARYPVLRTKIARSLSLANLSVTDRRRYQRFIEKINQLLDNDFIAVKEALFPDVWKLGVGVFPSTKEFVSFRLYKIPYGEPAPVVCTLDEYAPIFDQSDCYRITDWHTRRDYLSEPESAATDFVLDKVRQALRLRALPIHGTLLATDVLFFFVRDYFHCLGLPAESDSLTVTELSHALNNHLLGVCAAIASDADLSAGRFIHLDIDSVSHFLRRNDVRPIQPSETPVRFSLGSQRVSVRSVFEALRYLVARNVSIIHRPFPPRSRTIDPSDNRIWSGYSQEDKIIGALSVLEGSIQEYSMFVQGNRFRFPESPYLDQTTAVFFEYEPRRSLLLGNSPLVNEHHVDNPLGELPKLSVSVVTEGAPGIDISHFPGIRIHGTECHATLSTGMAADFLFHRNPVLNLVYRMLYRDLEEHYHIGLVPGMY